MVVKCSTIPKYGADDLKTCCKITNKGDETTLKENLASKAVQSAKFMVIRNLKTLATLRFVRRTAFEGFAMRQLNQQVLIG